MISTVLMLAAMLSGDPDGIIATAPSGPGAVAADAVVTPPDASPGLAVQQTPHGLTTEQQIDRWLGDDRDLAWTDTPDAESTDDRRIHGQISASIGSHDYRGYSGTVSLPIGDEGRLDLTYAQSKGGYPYYETYPGYVSGPFGQSRFDSRSFGLSGRFFSDDDRDRVPERRPGDARP